MRKEPKKFIFVAGSAMLDIISKITEYRHTQDNLGKTKLRFGGEAYNIATIFQNDKTPVSLCTALNQSAVSQMILNDLSEKQIRTHILHDPYLNNSVYNGTYHKGNQLVSVWEKSISSAKFSESFIEKGIKHAACIILTTCLGTENINRFINIANKVEIPVFINSISLMESEIIQNLKGEIDCIFLKDNEMNFLRDSIDPCLSWQDIAKEKNTTFIVTKRNLCIEIIKPKGDIEIFSTHKISKVKYSSYLRNHITAMIIKKLILEEKPLNISVKEAIDSADSSITHPSLLNRQSLFYSNMPQVINPSHYDTASGALNKEGLKQFLVSDKCTDDIKFLAVDIHDFKKITSKYDTQTEDEAILEIVNHIKEMLRNSDFIVRLEEDKLLCVLSELPESKISKITKRIEKSISEENYTNEGLKFKVSTSLTKYSNDKDFGQLMKNILKNIKNPFNA